MAGLGLRLFGGWGVRHRGTAGMIKMADVVIPFFFFLCNFRVGGHSPGGGREGGGGGGGAMSLLQALFCFHVYTVTEC